MNNVKMDQQSINPIVSNNNHHSSNQISNYGESPNQLIDAYEQALEQLSNEQIYDRFDHQFQADETGKLRGYPPFRESESGTSFTVFPDGGFYDSGDDFGGYASDYIHSLKVGYWEKAKGGDFAEAVRALCSKAGLPFPDQGLSEADVQQINFWQRKKEALSEVYQCCYNRLWGSSEQAAQALTYLHRRGFSDEGIADLGIGLYCHNEVEAHLIEKGFTETEIQEFGFHPRYNDYLTYPWYTANGEPLTVYFRYYQKTPPAGKSKTYALKGQRSKRSPLFMNWAVQAGDKELTFVEGVNDAALLQSLGQTNVIASVAASFSGDQIQHLKRHRIESVTLVNDPDAGGTSGTMSNIKSLTEAGIDCYVPQHLPNDADPDEFVTQYGISAWKEHLKTAQNGIAWVIDHFLNQYRDGTDRGRDRAIDEIYQYLAKFKLDDSQRSKLETKINCILGEKLGINVEAINLRATGKHVSSNSLSKQDAIGKIDELIEQNLSNSELQVQLKELEKTTGWRKSELDKLYKTRFDELEKRETRQNTKEELDQFLQIGQKQVKLAEVLEPNLAEALADYARLKGSIDEVVITTLLPIVACQVPKGTKLELIKNHFYANPIMYTCLIAESGSGKTPIRDGLKAPLEDYQQQLEQQWKDQLEQWKLDKERVKQHNKDKNADPLPEPEKPVKKSIFTDQFTGEALCRMMLNNPEHGILLDQEELVSLIKTADQYRGKGDDIEKLLKARDGGSFKVDRMKDEESYYVPESSISINGGIQPEVLQKHMDLNDPNGFWARFFFCQAPSIKTKFPRKGNSVDAVDVYPVLNHLYTRIRGLKPHIYEMDDEAHDLYANWCDHLSDELEEEDRQGVRAVLSKLRKHTGELALLLHLINHETPDHYVGMETVKKAIHLAQFYLDQLLSVHLDSKGSQDELSPKLKAIVELSQEQGWITARNVQRGSHKRKFKDDSAHHIRELFAELEELGYGITRTENNSTQYCNLDEGDTSDTSDNTPQSLIGKDSGCHQASDNASDTPSDQETLGKHENVTDSVTKNNQVGDTLQSSQDKTSEEAVTNVAAVTRDSENVESHWGQNNHSHNQTVIDSKASGDNPSGQVNANHHANADNTATPAAKAPTETVAETDPNYHSLKSDMIKQNQMVLARYGFDKTFIEKAIAQIDQTEVEDPPKTIQCQYRDHLWEIQLLNEEKAIGRCKPSEEDPQAKENVVSLIGSEFDIEPTLSL